MDDDLQIDSDEDLFRNPVYYEPAGRNLDLDRPDLGVPQGQDLLNVLLRMRGRVPIEKRGLICPDCRDLRGRRVSMYLVQRDGVWLASHYRKPGEKPISHESDEHLARKERVAKDSEDHGFHAEIESQTADGHARLDVRISGANGIVLGYEPQLSAQSARGMRAREGFRRRGGIQSVWDFADPDHAGIGAVPYVRTPNLPASVIRVQKNPIAVQDGNFVLEEGECSQNGTLTRCPEKPYDPENPTDAGYCGGWHRVLVPAHQSSTFTGEGRLTLTQFIVEAAAGERIPFQRGGHHGWLPARQWQQYLEANGPHSDDKERQSSVRQGDRRDRCTEDRPASEVRVEPKQRRGSRAIVLESRPRETAAAKVPVDAQGQAIPLCRFGCGQPASLPGPEGLPEHFSCRSKHEA
ncbi:MULTISPECIES: hypothetical protein [Streptomyces]|uniref:Uncharacterized protein n=1 Tax=Streptomyces parvus TaxID=66428 RepID=A0A5D4JL81_9ACTN|nr:hypothetical protein [Streptomyces parvus]TYR65566.1 hypothetical protein FY004_05540 [Streptomyces parvus]GGW04713.1 hypothetical protein GCM10010264_22290 [Streptomyces globisporus]